MKSIAKANGCGSKRRINHAIQVCSIRLGYTFHYLYIMHYGTPILRIATLQEKISISTFY